MKKIIYLLAISIVFVACEKKGGCPNTAALNYNPDAEYDNGTCIMPIYGCTDNNAFNYNPDADYDDKSCKYLKAEFIITNTEQTCHHYPDDFNPVKVNYTIENTGDYVIDYFEYTILAETKYNKYYKKIDGHNFKINGIIKDSVYIDCNKEKYESLTIYNFDLKKY